MNCCYLEFDELGFDKLGFDELGLFRFELETGRALTTPNLGSFLHSA
jgi:hypothetical protein